MESHNPTPPPNSVCTNQQPPPHIRTHQYTSAAAKALLDVEGLDAEQVAERAMKIAAEICVFTNDNFVKEVRDVCGWVGG